jgi:hypothetical protein
MDRDTILRYGAMDGSRPRLDWPPDDDEERDLLFLLDSLSLSLSPLSLSSGEKKKRRKFGLLEEQEKFVNFWSSYSLPAPLVGGLEYCSHSTKVWWWIGEGIDFLHHFALGFGEEKAIN